jgi:carboxyl-terminal processing protease
LGAGILVDRQVLTAHAQTSEQTTGLDLGLIREAWDTVSRVYVDNSAKQTKPVTYGAISGMVSALGDTGHSTFLTPEMVKAQQDYVRGQFEGIGAQVESKNGRVVIIAPMDNSPAQKAGIKPGDAILKVNGEDVSGLPLELVVSKILGPAGTPVTLTLLDPNTNQSRDITLVRARIVLNNVTWNQLPGTTIAHLRIVGFSQGVSQQLRQSLTEMKKQGVTSVILDLRNNPGGLLDQAVGTASEFLASGDVLLEKDAHGQIRHVKVRSGGVATDMSLVVLVNNGSASASEIVAGALQDANRAQLVGETTFGTGTVLGQFSLSDGSALMLATEEWLTPKGRVIWHKGIEPDKTVKLSSGAISLTPETERNMTAEQLRTSSDLQLLEAMDLLKSSAGLQSAPSVIADPLPGGGSIEFALEFGMISRI